LSSIEQAHHKHFWRRHQRHLAPVLFLLPAGSLFALFVIYPIIQTIRLSFYRWDGIGPKLWIGLENYRELFSDPTFFVALKNNLIWLALFGLAPLGGLVIALLLTEPMRGIRLIRSLFFMPFVISQVVVGIVFAWALHSEFGLFGALSAPFSSTREAPLASETWAIYAVIMAGLWPQTAYCAVLYLTGLATVRRDLVEAARIDGARGLGLIWNVVWPQLRPVTFIVAVVCMVSALRSFDLVVVMTGGGPYDRSTVLALYMYEQTFSSLRFGYAAAIAVVLLFLTLTGIAYFLRRLVRRELY
jgi:multiple sugar transport system permease protein